MSLVVSTCPPGFTLAKISHVFLSTDYGRGSECGFVQKNFGTKIECSKVKRINGTVQMCFGRRNKECIEQLISDTPFVFPYISELNTSTKSQIKCQTPLFLQGWSNIKSNIFKVFVDASFLTFSLFSD